MATQITNYQCPGCTGPLQFSPVTGKLECEYCGGSYSVAEVEALYAEKNQKAEQAAAKAEAKAADRPAEEGDGWGEDAEKMRAYSCPSCAAELICDETTAATSCPYCGNPTVVPGQFSNTRKPKYVLPFRVNKENAVEALRNHYKGKMLLPNAFANENHLQEIKGVYVPFWLYNAIAAADVEFEGQEIETRRTRSEKITVTKYYDVHRAGTVMFDQVPVDASTKMPDNHMDAIEPFDYRDLKPFAQAYLPGFLADTYDVTEEQCAERVAPRLRNSAIDAMRDSVSGYDSCSVKDAKVSLRRGKAEYALLPVWMLSTRWKDKNYLFAMNGQTGKLVGDLPISIGKAALWFGGIFLLIFMVLGWLYSLEAGLIGGLVIGAVVCLGLISTMKSVHRQTDANSYIPSSGIRITEKSDRYSHQRVTREKLED